MKKEIKNFGNSFVSKLGTLVKNMKAEGMGQYGLTEKEIRAVESETFYLLGRNHKNLKEEAKLV